MLSKYQIIGHSHRHLSQGEMERAWRETHVWGPDLELAGLGSLVGEWTAQGPQKVSL